MISLKRHTLLILITVSILVIGSTSSRAETVIFSQLSIPAGIATDRAGDIYVHSDAVSTTVLTKFMPDATPVGQVSLGGIDISEFVGSRLTRVPETDAILLLSPQGVIYHFTSELQGARWIDLRPLANSVAKNVYDVLREEFRPLNLGSPQYGDISAHWASNNELDLLLTATTGAAGGFSFVMRVRIDLENGSFAPQVVVTSQGTTAGNVNLAPGIAANESGIVLTTLPFRTPEGFADSLVGFRADFPEDAQGLPQFLLTDPQGGIVDFASSGMTVDEAGNFYIATGVVGSSVCGANASGALVFIDRQIQQYSCNTVGSGLVRSADVTVSPVDNFVYMTDMNGRVLRFDPIIE